MRRHYDDGFPSKTKATLVSGKQNKLHLLSKLGNRNVSGTRNRVFNATVVLDIPSYLKGLRNVNPLDELGTRTEFAWMRKSY